MSASSHLRSPAATEIRLPNQFATHLTNKGTLATLYLILLLKE